MAEFKLGRIRFIWKDEWSSSTTYYKDDVVRYGGKTFICVVGHIAQTDFMLDLNNATPKWQQFSDGQTWRGPWTVQTVYKINDIVKYGGYLYICNTGHISDTDLIGGLESNLGDDSTSAYWDLFGEGFDYKGDWATNTRYKVNDIIKYGSRIYICTTFHVSAPTTASGLELDQSKWDMFSDGMDWKTDWAISTRYRVGDLAKYGGQVYRCNTGHTSASTLASGLEADQSKWDYFHKGIEYRAQWTAGTRYRVNDVVKDSGGTWICTTHHTAGNNANLRQDQANWSIFIAGLEFEDTWGPYSEYQPGDIVTYGGYTYISKTNNTQQKPAEQATHWDVFVTGFNLRGDYADDSTNQDYRTGDVVRLGGWTYLATANSNGQRPPNTTYWEKLNEGAAWKNAYTDATYYDKGDVVTQGVNAYICVQEHTSNNGVNDPANDGSGTYWNFLSGGAESGNLTTAGDLVYYGGSGPQRLPIGKAGQVLKVNDDATAPEWTYFGFVNHVYYVDINGTDGAAPDRGITQDRPFKSIRFACEQIERGSHNANDRHLIEVNRAFLQAEVVEWIDYQIANNISPFTSSFTYNKSKCRRDTGIITDALAWDLSHGGNVRSRESALAYFVGSTSQVAGQEAETVAALEYHKLLITHVLAKTDPAANYQTLNSVASPITQVKPAAFETSNPPMYTPTGATYAPTTGVLVLTIGTHPFKVGDTISIADKSLNFTCAQDSHATNHYYPRSSDPASGTFRSITAITATQITVNVGISSNTTAHLFVSSTANSVTTKGVVTTSRNLLGLTTGVITAGNTTSLAAQVKAQKTIFVKTGEHKEVCPIIVPEDVAVVGDELRSTKIVPAPSTTSNTDTPKSIAALTRLAAIAANVIQNVGITKSSGNALTQVTSRPAGSAAAGAAVAGLFTEIADYIDYGVNGAGGDSTLPAYRGSITPNTTTEYTYAVEVLEQNKAFLIAEVHAYIAVTYPTYSYTIAACARDVTAYIDAIKIDIIYDSNYKSLLAGRYYVNAVQGNITEDMFYMRNGTGLRNCSLNGLQGTLSSANVYGTKRPSSGNYVSLDPGWGPAHDDCWIINKSPYVQNVSTFGTGCVGCKVDGDLHAGGNDSIVANDFTQILSDGIGFWVTNLGRAELVSVFTYYNHIGYLSENGGKIRGTNGNNSYGDFGSVAEGIDTTESPVTGKVDNQQLEAQISHVQTDGAQEILQVEYLNAGQGYTTEASTAILTCDTFSGADAARTGGSYKGITGSSAGSGTGQEFTVNVETNGSYAVVVTKGGTGHAINDTITINDSFVGGGGAANITFDVATIGAANTWGFGGDGFGAVVSGTNIRNGGVFEVQIDADSSTYGGDGYVQVSSNAQAGNVTQITLAATDVNPTGAYNGMSIYITSGLGKGQYGYIGTFNSATKLATVFKESDNSAGWESITGASIAASLDSTSAYIISPRVIFTPPTSGVTARGRARVADEKVVEVRIIEPGSGYSTPPTLTLIDPNNTIEMAHTVRVGNGVLTQPTFSNRGSSFITATATINGDGFADIRQTGTKIRVDGLSAVPQKGSNVELASRPSTWYKLVAITNLVGNGPYSALMQISPTITAAQRPPHDDAITIRRRMSQVRLTGHDFLDIGTGNFSNTNYPGDPLSNPDPAKETNDFGGGRVFYTSTDQDGNFRVGGLFNVEQATGIATLNVEAFNISGLNELQLGSVALGGAGAVISEFSTDGTFSADSDAIVPTQKAIKTYITSQIGGGVATLNVNSVTAGVIEITGDKISTTTGGKININNVVNFKGGIDGAPVALQMFLLN